MVRKAATTALASAEFECVGQAGNFESARSLLQSVDCDVVITDLDLGDSTCLDQLLAWLRKVKAQKLAWSGAHEEDVADVLAEGGVAGFVSKRMTREVFREAVRTVARGETFFKAPPSPRPEISGSSRLTSREHDVLRLYVTGITAAQMSDVLKISEPTVATHLRSIRTKLDVEGRAGLMAAAQQLYGKLPS